MKKYSFAVVLLFLVFTVSGCTILNTGTGGSKKIGGVLRSRDAGIGWELKNKVNEKQTITGVDVLAMAIDPVDTQRMYLGTAKNGIALSKNGAENWEKLKFPGNKVYGIAINYYAPSNIYALGVTGGRGKVYRTDNYGQEWKEVYTEPADGTVIISIVMDKNNPSILYLGTSGGVIIKTVDGGETWRNIHLAAGPVSQILFGGGSDSHIYFLVHKKQVLVSDLNGDNIRVIGGKLKEGKAKMGAIYSMAVNDNDNGGLYVGTDKGMFRSFDAGENLEEVNILASSREFPIRSIAINPENSQDIIYSAAQAIYKSADGGKNWSTNQLNTGKLISSILYNPSDVNTVYASLRDFNN